MCVCTKAEVINVDDADFNDNLDPNSLGPFADGMANTNHNVPNNQFYYGGFNNAELGGSVANQSQSGGLNMRIPKRHGPIPQNQLQPRPLTVPAYQSMHSDVPSYLPSSCNMMRAAVTYSEATKKNQMVEWAKKDMTTMGARIRVTFTKPTRTAQACLNNLLLSNLKNGGSIGEVTKMGAGAYIPSSLILPIINGPIVDLAESLKDASAEWIRDFEAAKSQNNVAAMQEVLHHFVAATKDLCEKVLLFGEAVYANGMIPVLSGTQQTNVIARVRQAANSSHFMEFGTACDAFSDQVLQELDRTSWQIQTSQRRERRENNLKKLLRKGDRGDRRTRNPNQNRQRGNNYCGICRRKGHKVENCNVLKKLMAAPATTAAAKKDGQ